MKQAILTVILVLAFLLAIVFGGVWIGIRRWRRSQIVPFQEGLEKSSEQLVIGPESVRFRIDGQLSAMELPGLIALTATRLVIRPLAGADKEILIDQIADVATNNWFHGNYRSGMTWLIVKRSDGSEIGLIVHNSDLWVSELKSRMPSSR
jgi:hypothetical protein